MNFESLFIAIEHAHGKLSSKAVSQVNYYNTLRYWLIGSFIIEFEQHGEDRAAYGKAVLKRLAGKLIQR